MSSLRHLWNDAQRSRLIAQLTANSRAFAAALPDEEAVDGLIMNLHLCLTLELSPAEVQAVFGARVLGFLTGMLATAKSDNPRPYYAIDPTFTLPGAQPLVQTQIGVIDAKGELRAVAAQPNSGADGTVRLIFRGRPGGAA